MRIGIDIRLIGKNRTGDEAVFFNLTKNLASLDNANEYYLFTDVIDENELAEIKVRLDVVKKNKFKIISIKTKNKFLWNFWNLPLYLRKNPVDVYLTQYITPFFVSKKIKIITIIHDISFNFFPQFIKKSDIFFLRILLPISIRRADKILGVSKFTLNEVVKYYKVPIEKMDFFYNAISEDFKNQNISEKKLKNVQGKYALPKKFILYLGTLQPRKNIPFLLESYARNKNKLKDIKIVLVGNRNAHNFDNNIDEAIKKYGLENQVIFPGFVDEQDKAAIYKLAQIFVFPSFYEGFGIPVLEAFFSGVPVLATDIPSLKEVAEKGAFFVELGDIDKFSKALYDICIKENLRKNLISSGKEIAELFSWEKSAAKVLTVFEKIVRSESKN